MQSAFGVEISKDDSTTVGAGLAAGGVGVGAHRYRQRSQAAAKKARVRRVVQTGAGVGVGVTGANEARGYFRVQGKKAAGHEASVAQRRAPGSFKHVPSISDAKVGSKVTQASHPAGTYHVSMNTLARYQKRPIQNTKAREKAARGYIQREGFTHPVQMRVYRNGAELWDGNHRAMGARKLGMKSIPVHVEHVDGDKPRNRTLYGAYQASRNKRYRSGLLSAASKIK